MTGNAATHHCRVRSSLASHECGSAEVDAIRQLHQWVSSQLSRPTILVHLPECHSRSSHQDLERRLSSSELHESQVLSFHMFRDLPSDIRLDKLRLDFDESEKRLYMSVQIPTLCKEVEFLHVLA